MVTCLRPLAGIQSKPLGHVCRYSRSANTRKRETCAEGFCFLSMPAIKLVTFNGTTKSIRQWSIETGIPYRSLLYRVNSGWDFSKAISDKPILGRNQCFGKDAMTDDRRREICREAMRRFREKNREHLREKNRKFAKENREIFIEKSSRRRAAHRLATPAWADKIAMRAIYKTAQNATKESGVLHHVDHIVPLRSKLVCGLHVHFNLQILTSKENEVKSNIFWPDMP